LEYWKDIEQRCSVSVFTFFYLARTRDAFVDLFFAGFALISRLALATEQGILLEIIA
jgi:hypothetical protein